MKSVKKQRHEAIIRIIEQNCLSTQTELLDKLHEEGFNTTQATISRDIKDLRLVKKVDELGRSRYTVDSGESGELLGKYRSIFGHSVISADYAATPLSSSATPAWLTQPAPPLTPCIGRGLSALLRATTPSLLFAGLPNSLRR